MRRRLLLITTSVAVLLAGGCGIPDDSDVTVVKTGPSTGISVVDDPPPPQQTRESTTNPATLANYYLQAAAGDPDTALDRVKEFMSPELAASFRPGSADDVKVVREVKDPLYTPGKTKVELAVQQVGTLSGAGVLTPPAGPTPTTSYTLEIDHIAGKEGLFVLQAPPVLLISDEALAHFYAQRTIYWWNKEYTGLVPDVRYMPLSFPSVQQPTAVLTWLTSGPADWLHDVVQPLPENTAMAENVPAIRDGTLQISLNAPALKPNDGQTLDRLRRQLQWSLRPLEPRTLELTIGRQDPVRFTNAEYLNSNQSYELADVPERFAIYNGVIRRLKGTPRASDPVPVLKNEANKNISAAAMNVSPTHTFAAVITGSGKSQHLRVGAAPLGERADLKVVGGLSGALGRPVWATTPDGDAGNAVGLITADGRLYSFRAAGGAAQRIAWQGAPGQVSAVSVAPDGRRVALVAGGRLYRTVLDYSGDTLAMGAPQQLVPPVPEPSTTSGALRPGFVKVAAVAWSSESYLAVAGDRGDGRYAVTDVTADGALALPNAGLTDIGTSPVTDLTAYPTNPVRGTLSSESYEAGDHAWDVLGDPQPITVEDLVGSFPGAKPGAATTAPFFLG
jgi:hypothetical protein